MGHSPLIFLEQTVLGNLVLLDCYETFLKDTDMTTAIWRYIPGPTDAAELVHVPCAPGETAQDAAERYFIEHPNADAALAVVYDGDNRAALAVIPT